MFIENLKEEMYDVISKERLLVLVSMNVDALCACKILQWLLKCDNVEYTLLSIRGKDDLVKAYQHHSEQVKHVVLINCGGSLNIIELLQPLDDVMFYIADSHRPLDLDNIYNQDQIKILMKEGEILEVPEFDDIYAASDDEEDEDSDEDNGTPLKRRRTDDSESPHKSSKEKRLWHKKRQTILYQYYENAFHGTSSAIVLYELCWKLNKDSNLALWWASVGLTDQLINERVSDEKYNADSRSLHQHVLRLNQDNIEENGVSSNLMKLTFEHDLRLTLYRHWSLFQSFSHSMYTACRFRIWTLKGKRRLREFLAEIGLPLHQCQQKFSAMDVTLKNTLKDSVLEVAEKYGLDEILFGSFNVQLGFKIKLTASDVVFAVAALIENSTEEGKAYSENFFEGLDALSRCNLGGESLEKGLDLSKKHLVAIWNQVHSFLSTHQIVCAGPFLYAHVREGAPDFQVFSTPMNATRLAKFVQNCYVIMSKNKRAAMLPLILTAPLNLDTGTCLVVGIPPVADDTRKNFLGRAFELAAEKTKCRSFHDNCEPAVVEIKSKDRGKFFDALSSLLA
ncbi:cell division control protein 45 homolog [Xenia sp. Carnegie-2017]|uniref:cell division control protein 45 homolog n=1 Tax=Xenia sp. Carnegie-2017 TaxID=2897299 RepID=UPI001F042B53|nr:cell division control protein 45 homolog [Xenia sp. Carnegie-2017]